jgi:hypothetical protein
MNSNTYDDWYTFYSLCVQFIISRNTIEVFNYYKITEIFYLVHKMRLINRGCILSFSSNG